MKTRKNAKINLFLVTAESAITNGYAAMSIMTLFFYSIGLTNADIAFVQSIFCFSMIFLDIPTGWLADRFGRKMSNIFGDLGSGLIFILIYANAQNMFHVVLAEVLLAITEAFSHGVDGSLIRHFSKKIDPSEKFFRSKMAKMHFWQHVLQLFLLSLGGPIGAISFRLAIAVSGIPHLIGAVISMFIDDDSEKIKPEFKNPFKDMLRIFKKYMKAPGNWLRVLMVAFGHEMTHTIIWFFTPMLIIAGFPVEIVSIGWIINSLAMIFGSYLAKRFANKLPDWCVVTLPVACIAIAMFSLSVDINLITVVLYIVLSGARGWVAATFNPIVQEQVDLAEQTSMLSFVSTVGRIIYVPASLITGYVADIDLRFAPLATFVIFIPILTILIINFKREK